MKCPNCGLISHHTALRCDCGYDFSTAQMKESYLSDLEQIDKKLSTKPPWQHIKWKHGVIRTSLCEFRMETIPGVIGGKMHGQLVLPEQLVSNENLCVKLTNIEDVSYDDGDYNFPPLGGQYRCLFDHTTTIDARDLKFVDGRCLIPVEFTVPYDTKDETDSKEVAEILGTWHYHYSWYLRVYTDTRKKRNLDISFPVPIFRTKASDPSIIAAVNS